MLTRKDMEDMGYIEDDMGLSYYGEVEKPKTPLEMVKEFQKLMKQEPDPDLYLKLVQEEMVEWLDEVKFFGFNNARGTPYNEKLELKELTDLLYVIYGYAATKGWDVMESFKRVHENNVGRCYQPDGSIRRRDDGKIVKNKDYPKVDLGDLV